MKAPIRRIFSRKNIIIALVLSTSIGLYSFADDFFEITRSFEILSDVFHKVNDNYVGEIDPGKLMKKGIDSMLISLDPYTNYIPESDIEDFRFMTTGQYGGIGASIRQRGEYIAILEPYDGFAADKAGLLAGDLILAVDGKSVKGKKTDDLTKFLKGQPGTSLVLTIQREGVPENLEIKVVREEVKIKSVPYYCMLNNDFGYIKLSGFYENAGKEVAEALKELKKNNPKGIVLDLRYNPGGLLNEAVNITNVFIGKNVEVVTTRGRLKDAERKYYTANEPVDTITPLTVLVNSNSASASEIVSGSIQDLDRGVVVGQRSFGKGLVQTTRPAAFNAQVKITTAKYYTPSGRCIQALDYSHRNEDGSVGHVPDSLIKSFKTHAGRTVYDGGGVFPDLIVKATHYSSISNSLLGKGYIFDYSVQYRTKHSTIAPAREFKITENDFSNFVAFVKDKDYDYVNKSEKSLEELKSHAEKEKYFDDIKPEYQALQNKLKHDKVQELQRNKEEVMQLITEQIVQNYYHQKGLIAARLNADPEIAKSIETLSDNKTYRNVLSSAYVNPDNESKSKVNPAK